MNLAYADKHGITLVHMLKQELTGISEFAAGFMIGMKLKPFEEVAKLINTAVGTHEWILVGSIKYRLCLFF